MRTATKTGVKTSTKVGVALISVGAIAAALILVLPKTQPTPIKLQPIFSPTTTTPIPSSTFGNQTPSTTAPTKPDLSFSTSVSPAFANGKLTFSWGNTGNAPAKFMTGQLTYIIESLDINGKVLATSQAVAGNDGTGSMTYVAGSMGPATVAYVPPAGTVKVRITLDSNKLIAESNENNNVITFDAPLATSPALVPSSTPSSSPSYSPTSSGTSYVPSPTSSY